MTGVLVAAAAVFWVSWVALVSGVGEPFRVRVFGLVDRGVAAGGVRAGVAVWVGGLLECRACVGWWVSVPVVWAANGGSLWGWWEFVVLLGVNGVHLLVLGLPAFGEG